jgi:hypothetical protein
MSRQPETLTELLTQARKAFRGSGQERLMLTVRNRYKPDQINRLAATHADNETLQSLARRLQVAHLYPELGNQDSFAFTEWLTLLLAMEAAASASQQSLAELTEMNLEAIADEIDALLSMLVLYELALKDHRTNLK